MSGHDDYRLTETDEAAIRAALARYVESARENASKPLVFDGPTVKAWMRRVGAHAIGCSLDDLRDVEIDWIDARIAEVVA